MSSAGERIAVLLLLIFFWLMAITASIHKSNTFDETAHLIGGYSYLHKGDYRIHPPNGVLPQKLAALPLLFMDLHFPSENQTTWKKADLWSLGFQFLFLCGNDADRMLLASRSMIALLGMALGLLVFLWSRQIFGMPGGFLSLALFVFCPTMLAHGSLATSDMASALFLMLSVWSLWNLIEHYSNGWLLLATLSIGALFVTKATWSVLLGIIPIMIAIAVLKKRRIVWKKSIFSALIIAGGAYLLIWSFYSFRYSASRNVDSVFEYSWDKVEMPRWKPIVEFARNHRILPEAWIYGTSEVLAATSRHNRVAFLNGNYSAIGWWYFFPYCFLIKTPLPLFAILAFAIVQAVRGKGGALYATTPLWILLIVYWIFAMRSELNLGQRYILPIYPAVYILAGSSASVFRERNLAGKAILFVALTWFMVESVLIRPDYLAYFNQLAGGPDHAYQHLVDSSLDWGQDLPGLHDWLERNGKNQAVYLSYFGISSPEYYGISATRLHDFDVKTKGLPQLRSGIYCVSATMLQCIYSVPIGHWAAPYEAKYQTLLTSAQSPSVWDELQRYRFARLAAFLRARKYDAQVGHSILIFRLTDAEIHHALNDPPAELKSQIEIRGTVNGYVPPFL